MPAAGTDTREPAGPPAKGGGPADGPERVAVAVSEVPAELRSYVQGFSSVFGRREMTDRALRYVVGLLSDLRRKNGQTMAERVEGIANRQAIHQLLRVSPWSARELDAARVRQALAVASTGRDAVLILDEFSVLKQGHRSVGVKRQYLGCVGKTANGQVAVTVHYADDRYDWPVTGQLYLPREWADDPVLRAQAAIPEDVVFLTKPQIALALLRRVRSWGLPPATVCADPGYCDLNVLGELDGQGRSFCLGAAADFGVRLPGGSGEVCRVDHLRAALPERLWPAVTYREGTKEPLSKEFAAVEVQAATAQASGPRVWLLLERPLPGEPGDPKQYVLNADPTYTLQQMACLAHRRPVSERFSYENGKDQVGLADYQGRTWPGFHHHLALVMLALTWLNLQRRPLPTSRDGGAPRPPAPARPPRAPSAPRGATVLQSGRRVTLRTAPVAPLPPAPPRLIWESVQAVRRRFVAWCQMMVVITLAPRIHRRDLPAFAHLG